MLYKPDWERAQQKFEEYWNRENHDRPLIAIQGTKECRSAPRVKAPDKLSDRWLDGEYIVARSREHFSGTYFGAEAFPNLWPNLGPDLFGAILGDELEFSKDTSWSRHLLDDWDDVNGFSLDPENRWLKAITALTTIVVEEAHGDYFVGMTDLHAGADGLVSLRGPENLCCDLIDRPEAVERAILDLFEVLKEVHNRLSAITRAYQTGSADWLGVWHPGRALVTSCDFMGMISSDAFQRFVRPELLLELDWLDASIFHVDGPSALRHLDSLLAIPALDGIQWCYGAGQPTAAHWIPVLQRIQASGKLIHITVSPSDIQPLLENLKPEGLFLDINPMPNDISGTFHFEEEEARDIVAKIERYYRL